MIQICQVLILGQVPYQQAWELQERLTTEIAAGARPPTLLLLEHPHTFTFGRQGKTENLLWDPPELLRKEVSVFWVDRAGDITYHGPGQLVGYPLLPLAPAGVSAADRRSQLNSVDYLRRLEETLLLALFSLGVQAHQVPGKTGVWIDCDFTDPPAKIASIGVKIDARGISRHGFSLNINPDMSYWQGIIACGIQDAPAVSLSELLNPTPTFDQTCQQVISAFGRVFNLEPILIDPGALLPTQSGKSE